MSNWHAGVEARISVLKRLNELDRCRDHGENGFNRWIGWGVIAGNLRVSNLHGENLCVEYIMTQSARSNERFIYSREWDKIGLLQPSRSIEMRSRPAIYYQLAALFITSSNPSSGDQAHDKKPAGRSQNKLCRQEGYRISRLALEDPNVLWDFGSSRTIGI